MSENTTPAKRSGEGPVESPDSDNRAKQLNVNAKAWVPRLEAPDLQQQRSGAMPPQQSPSKFGSASGAFPPPMMSPMMSPMNFSPMALARPFVPPALVTPMHFAQQSPSVSVGNATLVAQRSSVPPKFGCILLVGVPGAGKSTIGRQLVQELNSDNMNWSFFSGGDHLKESHQRPAPWDTTKTVLDALCETLDLQLSKQATTPIRGLLIDKQCRGVEDLYYLTSILRQRGLLLWGIIGMEVSDDTLLLSRGLSGSPDALKEKIKFHRVVESRLSDAARSVGLWRTIDASQSKADVVKSLRTMVLGCSSQSPTKQLASAQYHESPATMIDDYRLFAQTLLLLSSSLRTTTVKSFQFPGWTAYTPLPESCLEEVKKRHLFSDYVVRRKADGTKHVLVFDGTKLFLVPRHMRCVFEVPLDAWLGVPLSNQGKFILDCDLVKMTKERSKEKVVVYDILFWSEKGSIANLVARSTWRERQERLKTSLCSEATAFFPKKGDLVVVHQTFEEIKNMASLLEPCDYPCEGIVFQPTNRRDDFPYLWRPVDSITVDFRVGSIIPLADVPDAKLVTLELFDNRQAKYLPFHSYTVVIPGNRPQLVEGALIACGLETDSDGKHSWYFQRMRFDVPLPWYVTQAEELLTNCLVPKHTLLAAFGLAKEVAKDGVAEASRVAFGSSLGSPAATKGNSGAFSDAHKLSQTLSVAVKVQPQPSGQSTVSALEKLLKGPTVTVVRDEGAHRDSSDSRASRRNRNTKFVRDDNDGDS